MSSIPAYKHLRPIVFRTAGPVVVFLPIIGTILAIILLWHRVVHWSDLILLAVMYILGMFGLSVGYHRMLSHRSFQPHPLVKAFFLILGTMSAQGPALEWAATHVKHHAHTDREGDPHSPVEGFFHAHIGWFLKNGMADPNVYCPYLIKDRLVVFISYNSVWWIALGFIIPFVIGGWTGLLWGGLVRMFLVNHVFWGINAIGHSYGMREFETNDQSHNEFVLALLGLGEGWHNNHHAFPRAACVTRRWWQFDPTGYLILALGRLGLARDVHHMSPALIARYDARKALGVPTLPEHDE